jgi:hypothetical protein
MFVYLPDAKEADVTRTEDHCVVRLCERQGVWAASVLKLSDKEAIVLRDGLLKAYPLEPKS